MVRRGEELDRIMATRFSRADTPKNPTTIDALRAGIRECIMIAVRTTGVPLEEVPCPPMEQWGERPLPQPTRLRLCSPKVYRSLEECVRGEFALVLNSMVPVIPAQPVGVERLETPLGETVL